MWQKIETAPMNQDILAYGKEDGICVVKGEKYSYGKLFWTHPSCYDSGHMENPTHWQLLPQSPETPND